MHVCVALRSASACGRMFYGSLPIVEQEVNDSIDHVHANSLINHEVVIAENQNSQAALFVCNLEIKNLREEVAALKSTISELHNKDKGTRTNAFSSKLP